MADTDCDVPFYPAAEPPALHRNLLVHSSNGGYSIPAVSVLAEDRSFHEFRSGMVPSDLVTQWSYVPTMVDSLSELAIKEEDGRTACYEPGGRLMWKAQFNG